MKQHFSLDDMKLLWDYLKTYGEMSPHQSFESYMQGMYKNFDDENIYVENGKVYIKNKEIKLEDLSFHS